MTPVRMQDRRIFVQKLESEIGCFCLDQSTRRVEQSTIRAVEAWRSSPYLGGNALGKDQNAPGSRELIITSDVVGYVQHVDAGALSVIAEDASINISVIATPGKVVGPGQILVWLSKTVDENIRDGIKSCFAIGDTRSFDQDPRFGASVLTEIASRALSPAINDPGTAIDVLSRTYRILVAWKNAAAHEKDVPQYPRLYVAPIELSDIFDDLFKPIARDGAGMVEVGVRLQKTLAVIAQLGEDYKTNSKRHSEEALERAHRALNIDADRQRVVEAASSVGK